MPGNVVVMLPLPPAWMRNRWAVHEWQRLGPVLLRAGLLTEGNLVTFAQLCAMQGRIATAYEDGEIVKAAEVAQYIKLVGEFGLTPGSASKVRAPDPAGNKGNRFGGNGKR